MKELCVVCLSGMLVCCVLATSAQGTLTSGVEEWGVTLLPGESFTCVAYYIPEVDPLVIPVPESLVFYHTPAWTSTFPFDYIEAGWQTALSADNRVAYLYGPQITNNSGNPWHVFSFELAYQWDEADVVDYPVYNDFVIFDGETLVYDFAWQGIPGVTWEEPDEVTYLQQYDPTSDPYTNPVPGPATLSLVGFGMLFLRKRRRGKFDG
jgi:hypothetical protein